MNRRDLVLAILGSSSGLSGLSLVFLGLIISAFAAINGNSPPEDRSHLKHTAVVMLAAFAVGIVSILDATSWLLTPAADQAFYVSVIILFFAETLSLLVAAVWAMRGLL